MLPIWLAVAQSLGAAILFAVGIQFLNLGLRHGDSRTGTLIDIGTTTFFYLLLSPIFLNKVIGPVPVSLSLLRWVCSVR